MNIKRKIFYYFFIFTCFSQIILSAVERLDLRSENLSDNASLADRQCAQAALAKAGITENLTNEAFSEGGYGKVLYTQNYAVKISTGEYLFGLNNAESSRLHIVKNHLQRNPPAGINFCLPKHIYKVYVNGSNYKYDDVENEYIGFNVQIMPRIPPKGTICQVAIYAIINQDSKNLETMRYFGEKMGQFQNWGLIQKPEYANDITCLHGDLNPSNVLITATNARGSGTEFTFIDNADFSAPQLSINGGGSLASDITYLTYMCASNALKNGCHNWENGLEATLKNFYMGYISQLPRRVCEKLIDSLYGIHNGCLSQTERDINYDIPMEPGFSRIPNIQTNAFRAAYRTIYPYGFTTQSRFAGPFRPILGSSINQPIVHQPIVHQPVVHRPLAPPVLNKAAQKAAVRAHKAAQKNAVRQQRNAAKAQKAARKNALKAQKVAQKAAKKGQKALLKAQKNAQRVAAKLNKKRIK